MYIENVFEFEYKLYARLFDEKTRTSKILTFNNYEYVPSLFLKSKTESEYKDFYLGTPLQEKTFKTTYELFQFLKSIGVQNQHRVFGNTSRPHKYIRDNADKVNPNHEMRIQFLDIETRAINGFAKPTNPTEEVSLIQTYDTFLKKFVIFGTQDYNNSYKSELGEVIFKKCKDEVEMLTKYLAFLDKTNPAIISGFNTNAFDLPYLANRLDLLGIGGESLSPIRKISYGDGISLDGLSYKSVNIAGVLQLDLRDLYIKYTTQRPPRFSLNDISKVEGIGNKIEYDGSIEDLYKDYQKFVEYGIRDVELLIKLENKLKLIKVCCLVAYSCGVNANEVSGTYVQWGALMYNTALKQGRVLPLKQIPVITESVPYPGGWVRATEGLHKNVCSYDFTSLYPNIIIEFKVGLDNFIPIYQPPKEKLEQLERNRAESENDEIKPITVCNLPDDLFNLWKKYFNYYDENYDKSDNDSIPEFLHFKELVDNRDEIMAICRKYKVAFTPNGCLYFTNGTSIFSSLIENFFKKRVATKKKMKTETDPAKLDELDLLQYMYKILMNSAYGTTALDSNVFSFGKKMAESITTAGRYLNMWVSYRVNKFCKEKYNLDIDLDRRNISVQCDTDSNYFEFNFLDTPKELSENNKFLREYCKNTIDPVIVEAINEAVETLTGNPNQNLAMEQETVCDRFLSCANKRYVGRYDKKGKTAYKITGLSMNDKSTSKWSKEKLNNCVDLILDEDLKGLRDYVSKIEKEFKEQALEDILTNQSVNSLKYSKKGNKWASFDGKACPLQSRGSINFNNLIKEKGFDDLDTIKEGQKIFIVYLLSTNPYTNDNCICVPDDKLFKLIPNLVEYVDYKTLFEKNFLQKLEIMAKFIGYSYSNEFSDSLSDWF